MSTQESFIPVKPQASKFPAWSYKSDYRVVDNSNVRDALTELVNADVVAWDSEFDDRWTGHSVEAFSFSTKHNTGWLIPVGMEHMSNVSIDVAKKFVYAISRKENVVQNAGAEMRTVLDTWNDESLLNISHDIQVLWYLKDPNEAKDFKEGAPRRRGAPMPTGFSLTQMALKYLGLETPDLGDFFKNDGKFRQLDPETARVYGCADADVTLRLYHKGMDPAMKSSFIYNLDMAVLKVLFDMERRGVFFQRERVDEIEVEVRKEVAERRAKVYDLMQTTPDAVNIDGSTQLRRHLFNTLNWPGLGKKTKDGLYSTDKTAMARYSEMSDPKIAEAAKAYMAYKKLKTLHNNFLTKLPDYVNPVTGAIHCHFLSTVVPTGRLACASPNLQQIPQRNEKTPIRRAFVARPGYVFVEADHSQVELRVYAGETKESYYYDSFANNVDLHLKTASVIFREQITSKDDPRRQMGKTMNFGPIYGMKPEGLAYRTDYSLSEAEQILDDFFSVMPDAVAWTTETHAKAKSMGGVHTHFGRWRPLPWLHSRIPSDVEFGERSAVNTIVQGTAADIMKIGLVRIWKALRKPDCPFDAHLVLTVHDSVMLEVAEGTDMQAFFEWMREHLCFEIEGYPPLEIDAKWGRNWHDMEDLKFDSTLPPADPLEPQDKEIVLPDLNDDQKHQLLTLLRTHEPGHINLMLKNSDGSALLAKPLSVDGHTYQQVLVLVVGVARQNQQAGGTNSDIPVVSFV